jgi:hypothetical protein
MNSVILLSACDTPLVMTLTEAKALAVGLQSLLSLSNMFWRTDRRFRGVLTGSHIVILGKLTIFYSGV